MTFRVRVRVGLCSIWRHNYIVHKALVRIMQLIPYFSDAASEVFKKYGNEFCKVVDTKSIWFELKRKKVIPDDLITNIDSVDDKKAREMLFQHLDRNADVATLREYCKIAISADGFPKMQALGKKMLRDLPPEGLLGLVGVLLA